MRSCSEESARKNSFFYAGFSSEMFENLSQEECIQFHTAKETKKTDTTGKGERMKNLFKFIGHYWKAVIAIVAILGVQAYCDLSLPAYTSDIVNIGIQQGGIEDQVPIAISEEEWNKMILFVSGKDQDTVENAYQKDENSYDKSAFVLKTSIKEDTAEREQIEDILALPMMVTSGLESGSEKKTQKIEQELKKQIPEESSFRKIPRCLIFSQMMPQAAREELVKEIQKVNERYAGYDPGTGSRKRCENSI